MRKLENNKSTSPDKLSQLYAIIAKVFTLRVMI